MKWKINDVSYKIVCIFRVGLFYIIVVIWIFNYKNNVFIVLMGKSIINENMKNNYIICEILVYLII